MFSKIHIYIIDYEKNNKCFFSFLPVIEEFIEKPTISLPDS